MAYLALLCVSARQGCDGDVGVARAVGRVRPAEGRGKWIKGETFGQRPALRRVVRRVDMF